MYFHASTVPSREALLDQPEMSHLAFESLVPSICPTDLPISRVDTREIDFVDELYSRWLVGILIATMHLQGVDSVLVNALRESYGQSKLKVLKFCKVAYVRRAKDCAIPV